MSIAVDELKTLRVIDPRLDINNSRHRKYGVLDGGRQVTWKQFISNSFNNSQISFSCDPPNSSIYVDRRMYIQTKFLLTFTGQSAGAGIHLIQAAGLKASPGVNPGITYYDAPRCMPMANATSTCTIKMNNDSLTSNLHSYWRALTRFQNSYANQNGNFSGTASMPDMSQEYGDLDGFPLNPLGGYGDNVVQCPRGGFVGCLVTRNDSTGAPGDIATVEMTVFEPMYLSPWSFGEGQEEIAFIQLQNIFIQLNLGGRGVGNLSGLCSSLWSHSNLGSVLTNATADVLESSALFSYITPDITQSLPATVTYSYYEPVLYPTTSFAAVNGGAQQNFQMNTVNLSTIPNRMYIFVAERDQDVNIGTTDTFFGITNLNITFVNQDGIFANASQFDLYQMTLRAGSNVSWRQFTTDVGSVICIQFGLDLPLGALQAPGLRGNFALSMKVQATNLSRRAIVPTLSVLVINEGVLTIDRQQVIRSVGVLNESDILTTKDMEPQQYFPSQNIYGSGFWSKALAGIKSFAKNIGRPALDVAKTLMPGNPYLDIADKVGKATGYGKRPRAKRGGALVGGQKMSSSQLLQLLNE